MNTPQEDSSVGRRVVRKMPVDPSPSQNTNVLFKDATSKYGLENVSSVRNYAIDFTGDGIHDLVTLPDFYSQPTFYAFNVKRKKFEKIKKSPFKMVIKASYLVWADFDKDGILDVVVGTLVQRSRVALEKLRIFRGHRKNGILTFKEQNSLSLDPLPASSVSIIDFDNDGLLDLFISNWVDQSVPSKVKLRRDYLLRATAPFKFRDESFRLRGELEKENGRHINIRPTIGSSTCDIDRNGYIDILTVSSNGYGNKLWLNTSSKKKGNEFEDHGKSSHYSGDQEGQLDMRGNGNSFFSACTDYNDDGIIDIFLGEQTHSYDNSNRDRSSILTGYSQKSLPLFFRSPYLNEEKKHWDQSDRRALWVDVDNDGLQDIIVENSGYPPKTRMITFLQNPDYSFKEYSLKSGMDIVNPSGVIHLDLNEDGREDIIVGQTNVRDGNIPTRIWVFENQNKIVPKVLKIYLRGQQSNFYGVGATIEVRTDLRVLTRFVEFSQGSLPSSNAMYSQVTLQEKETAQYLTVSWPKGNKAAVKKVYRLGPSKKNIRNLTVCETGKILHGVGRKCPIQ